MFRKAVIALALLASANAQVVTKKVASFQVCGQYFTGGISSTDAATFNALGVQGSLAGVTAATTSWKSGGVALTGPLFAGACGTAANAGTGIGRVFDVCDPNVYQPIAVNFPCTITAAAAAGAVSGGTCPNAAAGAPTAAQIQTFCAAQTFPAPAAATAAAFCRGEIDIIGAGKYAGHSLVYDYTLTPTYTLRQGAHTGVAAGANLGAATTTINAFVTCVYYPTFAATTGRPIIADGKYFKSGWIKKLVASVTIAPTRLTGGFLGTTADFVAGTPLATGVTQALYNAGVNALVPADTTGVQWAETITVTYVKPYYNLQFL